MKRKRTRHLEFIIGDILALALAVVAAFYLFAGNTGTLLSDAVQTGFLLAVLMLFSPAVSLLSLDMIIGCYLVLLGVDSIVLAFGRGRGGMDYRW